MLSPEEKAAGRRFRDDCQAWLINLVDTTAPTFIVPNFIAIYRHPCPARNHRSTAMELAETYLPSPAFDTIPAGRFAFLYRSGRCRHCGQTGMSRAGRLVDAHTRPPLKDTR